MPNDNSFTNLLRNLLAPNVVTRLWGSTLSTSQNDPVELSRSLLTARGQASGVAIADRVLSLVEEADEADLTRYFAALRDEFEVDLDEVLATAARAQTERLKGLAQSHGVMVNYLYELDRVEARHESFAATAELALSRDVSNLLNRPRPWDEAGQVEGRDYAAEPSS